MENLRDHTIAWLDSIGADGLMVPDGPMWPKARIDEANDSCCWSVLVPAYRHADGAYHTEADESICHECSGVLFGTCDRKKENKDIAACDLYQSWLAHKEEAK